MRILARVFQALVLTVICAQMAWAVPVLVRDGTTTNGEGGYGSTGWSQITALLDAVICLAPYRVLVRCWLRVCWSPSVSSESVLPAPRSCRNTPALHRSPSVVARRPGSTGAGNVRPFCDRPLLNGPHRQSTSLTGPACIIISSERKAARTRRL